MEMSETKRMSCNETDNNENDEYATASPVKTKSASKQKLIEEKKYAMKIRREKYEFACQEYLKGTYKSIYDASKNLELSYTSLYRYIVNGDEYSGQGRKLQVLTKEEETKIVDHIVYRQKIGLGVTMYQLQLLIQEVLTAVCSSNPERVSAYEHCGQLPNRHFVSHFVKRHNLTLRATMEISKGRQILSTDDLEAWQRDTEIGLLNLEKFKDCFVDSRRIFNQDETSIQVGSDNGKVLALKGTKVIYRVGGSSREHVTASYTVSAAGDCVPPHIFYKGVRNVALQHLKDFPTDGKSGCWKFDVTDNGYVNRVAYVDILKDLDDFLTTNNIPRPVVLFIDGPNAHISLQAAEFCNLKDIQPWILRANMTHLLQPLDLTFFSSLKKKIIQKAHIWQGLPENAGKTLNKYTVMPILHATTEECLEDTELIPNGFRRAGIFPWDPSAPDRSKLEPGTIFAKPNSATNCDQLNQTSDTISPPMDAESSQSQNDKESVRFHEEMILSDETLPISGNNLPSSTLQLDHEMETAANLLDSEESVGDSQSLDPQSQSNPAESSWHGKTKSCSFCNRKILLRFYEMHSQTCTQKAGFADSEADVSSIDQTENVLSTVPQFSLEDRCEQLQKFEVLLLKKNQVDEFNDFFKKKHFNTVKEPLYKAWLNLKFASIGTEVEAVDHLLASKVAKNVQKRKNQRRDNRPTGPARYKPNGPEWNAVLLEQENKKQSKVKKGQDRNKRSAPANKNDVTPKKAKKS